MSSSSLNPWEETAIQVQCEERWQGNCEILYLRGNVVKITALSVLYCPLPTLLFQQV